MMSPLSPVTKPDEPDPLASVVGVEQETSDERRGPSLDPGHGLAIPVVRGRSSV